MGFFSSYFSGSTYSTKSHPLSTEELHHLFSTISKPNLTHHLKEVVSAAILSHRTHDGKISLNKIHDVLHELKHNHTLTELDQHDFFAIFKQYFETHFKD